MSLSLSLSELHSDHLQQWSSVLSIYHKMEGGFRGYSSVQCSTVLGFKRKRDLKVSLWASLKSLATLTINVIKWSLTGKRLSWSFTCAEFHLSRFSGVFGSKAVSPLVSLQAFSGVTSARYWFVLCSSFRVDIGNMSFQECFKRFKINENFPIDLTISTCLLVARVN